VCCWDSLRGPGVRGCTRKKQLKLRGKGVSYEASFWQDLRVKEALQGKDATSIVPGAMGERKEVVAGLKSWGRMANT